MKSARQHAAAILLLPADEREAALECVPEDERELTHRLLADWIWKWSLPTFRQSYAGRVAREDDAQEQRRMIAMVPPEWRDGVRADARAAWRVRKAA